MVPIDNVYQKVLVLANKEQRGYITPQEFNRLADRAQMEIFESYFHDIKTAHHKLQNGSEESDELDMLLEKLSVHKVINDSLAIDATSGVIDLASFSSTPYRLSNIRFGNDVVQEVTRSELGDMLHHPLTAPTASMRVYYRTGENMFTIVPIPTTSEAASLVADYVVAPTRPAWGYVVVNSKPLYNANTSVDFDLHASEEENLVVKILESAGIVLNKVGLAQTAASIQQRNVQNENN